MRLPFKYPAVTRAQRLVAEKFQLLVDTLATLLLNMKAGECVVYERNKGDVSAEYKLEGKVVLVVGILRWDDAQDHQGCHLSLRFDDDTSINLDYTIEDWTISFSLPDGGGEDSPIVVAARSLGINIGPFQTLAITQEQAIRGAIVLSNYFIEHRGLH